MAPSRLAAAFLLLTSALPAEVQRVVIFKVDGLPAGLVQDTLDRDRAMRRLPWIRHYFEKNGTRMQNFYTRGISLSVPSWQLLDTGQHLQIHGNVEYDRYTQRIYDYLNFFPFYVNYARSKQVDMPGVAVLDSLNMPLLLDRFPYQQRYQGFQLYQRQVRWKTLQEGLSKRFTSRPVQQLFDEWQAGFQFSTAVTEQLERELIAKLQDPSIRYLDYFSGDYDHQAHLSNDRKLQLHLLDELDRLIGRIGAAIESSPLAANTVFIVVSDHGMNTAEGTFSQGYSLVNYFNSKEGGAHHVITNRHTLTEFKIRGLNPFVNRVLNPSGESLYLKDQAEKYPTVLLDLDGNERANVHFRNNALNQLHLCLQQISRGGATRALYADLFLQILDTQRGPWQAALKDLNAEIARLRGIEQKLAPEFGAAPKGKKWSPEESAAGDSAQWRRQAAVLKTTRDDIREYSEYARKLGALLSMTRERLLAADFQMEELIPPGAMGEPNTLDDLRSYVVGWNADGRTFHRINYLQALKALRVKNNVQPDVSSQPVDFIAVRLPDSILLYGGEERQMKIYTRPGEIRCEPVGGWKPGLPLHLMEDPDLRVIGSDRVAWLSQWHSEREWLEAIHKTKYSNGLIGLTEQFYSPFGERRRLVQTDLLLLANDHWNFNTRGFNPGGNHGSFFRISTHSVLMFWGGEKTGVPKGLLVERPYDSLSLVPTILYLMGAEDSSLPGERIRELGADRH